PEAVQPAGQKDVAGARAGAAGRRVGKGEVPAGLAQRGGLDLLGPDPGDHAGAGPRPPGSPRHRAAPRIRDWIVPRPPLPQSRQAPARDAPAIRGADLRHTPEVRLLSGDDADSMCLLL